MTTRTNYNRKAVSKKLDKTQLLSILPYMDEDTIANVLMQSDGWNSLIPETENKIEYPSDPVKFITDTLGYQMWDKLEDICRSVENNHNTVVSSCFGAGKSLIAAALAIYWLTTKNPSMVITIAPTWNQIQTIIWGYIRSAAKKANFPTQPLETPRWKINENQVAYGLSPRKSTETDMASLAGRHSENLLVIMDEGSGLPKLVWDTVQGLTVGGKNRTLCISNPVDQSGPLWAAMNSKNWNPITISAFDHPNVKEGIEKIPGAVTRQWIEDRCNDWAIDVDPYTPDSVHIWWADRWVKPMPIFKAKVLGEAPEQAEDQLISLAWVKLAQENEAREGEMICGLDPARSGGDDSALCIRNGMNVISIQRRKGQNSNSLAGWLQDLVAQYNIERIFIDEIGIGAGCLDAARKMNLPAIGVNFARQSTSKKRFVNMRAECWWNLREAFRLSKISIPNDAQLEGDLTAPRYTYDTYSRVQIESKDELKKRLGRSPDSGDALALTFSIPWKDDDYGFAQATEELSSGESWGGSRWVLNTNKKIAGRWKK